MTVTNDTKLYHVLTGLYDTLGEKKIKLQGSILRLSSLGQVSRISQSPGGTIDNLSCHSLIIVMSKSTKEITHGHCSLHNGLAQKKGQKVELNLGWKDQSE